MPWKEKDRMSLRREFVAMAEQAEANISALCRHYSISRKTGYKWLQRAQEQGVERSRRPHHSPSSTALLMQERILSVRDAHPDWGARKLKRWLEDRGVQELPALSTITAILQRHGRIRPEVSAAATPWQRFEHPQPNALWQMDFKGHFALGQGRCHALTVLDDHSRFNLVLRACQAETFAEVQPSLEACFRRYGLHERISCDNGSPWGTVQREDRLTRLGVWLIRLGVGLSHARTYHPQTNGKDERFHRTLQAGLLRQRVLRDQHEAQQSFDAFRDLYNFERPHQALGLAVPASRYRPSARTYPDKLPAIDYDQIHPVRKVDCTGRIDFRRQRFRISKALAGQPVALCADPDQDGCFTVLFCHHRVRQISLLHPDLAD